MKKMLTKIKEASLSILPVGIIILIISLIPTFNVETKVTLVFVISCLFLIIGIALFSFGSEISMEVMGENIGSSLVKTKKLILIVMITFLMGVLITIVEPDLNVLADEVSKAFNKILIILMVGFGVGIFLCFYTLKTIFKRDLNAILMLFYLIVFSLAALLLEKNNKIMIPLAFDSGGVTTGPVTVPFLMAFGIGLSTTLGGKNYKENSFGIISLCSIGPIIVLLLYSIFMKQDVDPELINPSVESGSSYISIILETAKDVIIAISLIMVVFLIINFIFIKLSSKKLLKILLGLTFVYFGLVLFLSFAQIGFMPMGLKLGSILSTMNQNYLIIFGLVIASVVVIAEPAINVLTHQVEQVTTGGINKRELLIALMIASSLAIGLSIIRIIFKFSLLFYLVPGYILAFTLSLFVPKIYTSIAFDAGGVASGPLTSSFLLPLAIGSTISLNGTESVLNYGFGIIAMVAMMPLIAVQILGFKSIVLKNLKIQNRQKKLLDATDEAIIIFK